MGACRTCGEAAGMLRNECQRCRDQRLQAERESAIAEPERAVIAAAEAEEKAERIQNGRNMLCLWYGYGEPTGPDWYTCTSCGRRESIADGGDAKLSRVAAVFGDCPTVWLAIRQLMLNGLSTMGVNAPLPIYPSQLEAEHGVPSDDAVAKLTVAAALGLLVQHGSGFVAGPPLCRGCYDALSERFEKAVEDAQRAPQSTPDNRREPIPAQLRFQVLQRDGFRCRYCGRSAQDGAVLHVDHVVPVALGGRPRRTISWLHAPTATSERARRPSSSVARAPKRPTVHGTLEVTVTP